MLRSADILNVSSYLITLWDNRLSKKSKDNLSRALEVLRTIHDRLTEGSVPGVDNDDRLSLARACQTVNSIFSEEHGIAVRAGDKVGYGRL